MILAGGKGTRLESLTRKIAKPAVSYGGKYRIIDFPLSNCANSGIDTVGVLTQYESVALDTYIGNGEKWGLNGVRSLTTTLHPRQTEALRRPPLMTNQAVDLPTGRQMTHMDPGGKGVLLLCTCHARLMAARAGRQVVPLHRRVLLRNQGGKVGMAGFARGLGLNLGGFRRLGRRLSPRVP